MGWHEADALRSAVSEVLSAGGPEVLDQPARFRSMLSDMLAADTDSLRDEQSVLVSLVERGLAGELVDEQLTPARRSDLVQRIGSDGSLSEERITSALDAFDAALTTTGLRPNDGQGTVPTGEGTLPTQVVDALCSVLVAGGPDVLDQPARFRSMLADVLGPQGSTFRQDQLTLNGLVEQGVGARVAEGSLSPTERAEMVSRLQSTLGREPADLHAGIDALDRAVTSTGVRPGVRPATPTATVFPTARSAIVNPTQPSTVEPAGGREFGADATWGPAPVSPPIAYETAAVPPPPVASPPPSEPGARRRRAPILIAVAVFVVIGAIVTVVLVSRSPQKAAAPVSLTFPTQDLSFAHVDRTWELVEGQLVGTVALSNTTGDKTTGRYVEAFPKSLASSSDQIRSDPTPSAVLKADPVLAWDVVIDAGATTTITYRIDVDDSTDAAQLETWRQEQQKTFDDYQTESTKKPSLTIVSPADGTTIDTSEFDLVGTTDPGATVVIDGIGPVLMNPDGTWAYHLTGLIEGANQYSLTATGTNGQTTNTSLTVVYSPPAPPPTAAPTTTTPKASPVGESSNPTPDPPKSNTQTATPPSNTGTDSGSISTPQPDPPSTPIVATGDSYYIIPNWNGYEFYSYKLPVLDNDSGPYNYIQATTSPSYGNLYWDVSSQAFYYQPYYNGYYTDSFQYYLYNTQTGQYSSTVTVYLTIYYNANP